MCLLYFKPLVKILNFNKKSEATKFPESFWKFVIYSCLWAYTAWVLILSGRYNYFTKPETIWDGKSFDSSKKIF